MEAWGTPDLLVIGDGDLLRDSGPGAAPPVKFDTGKFQLKEVC